MLGEGIKARNKRERCGRWVKKEKSNESFYYVKNSEENLLT